ncbi:MAG: ceramidase domain-containing protein [Pseudomonadota bacterium]
MTSNPRYDHRHVIIAGALVFSFAAIWLIPPIAQDPAYHLFADQRPLWGIPNFADVVSNVGFLLVAIAGCNTLLQTEPKQSRLGWYLFFIGVGAIGLGSAYYHWVPTNGTLFWDRLPMTVAFMSLLSSLIAEYINPRWETPSLVITVPIGVFSVLYWHWADDLRLYGWVQFTPLLVVALLLWLFNSRHRHQWWFLAALALYAGAKVTEHLDHEIFALSKNIFGLAVSGHTLKHVLAAAGCYCLVIMWKRRIASQGG